MKYTNYVLELVYKYKHQWYMRPILKIKIKNNIVHMLFMYLHVINGYGLE